MELGAAAAAQAVHTAALAARCAEPVFNGTAWARPWGQPLCPARQTAQHHSQGLRDRQRWWHWAWEAPGTGDAAPLFAQQSALHGYKQPKDPHTLPTPHRIFRELLENHTCCQLTKPANYTIC